MRRVLTWGGQTVEVEVASTFWNRATGLMWTEPRPLMIHTRMVHGFGLRSDLWVVGIDAGGTVMVVERLRRRRLVRLREARWTLELPLTVCPPEPGTHLALGL